jgi:hypothetical protein
MKISHFCKGFPRWSTSNGTFLGVHVAGKWTSQVSSRPLGIFTCVIHNWTWLKHLDSSRWAQKVCETENIEIMGESTEDEQ